MTTATLDASAVEVKATEEATEGLTADNAMQGDRARVVQLAGRERGFQTRVRLEIGSIIANRMRVNCDSFANSDDERPNIRSQTAKLFAIDLSSALGAKIDDKEVYRLVRADAMRGLLPDGIVKDMVKLSWDAIRSLARWCDWNQKDDEFTLRFSVDIGIRDENGRTTRDIDAETMLAELIPALVASPKSASKIRAIMDEREEAARKGELTLLNDRQRKQASAAKSMADRVKANEERAALFDAFARKIVNAKLSADQVLDELFRRGLIPTPEIDGGIDASTIAQLTADEATTVGKVLNHAKNMDAMVALYKELKPIIEAGNVSQPSKSASATLDATGSTRKIA